MRLSYPPNIKIIKVPCTGRVDIILPLKAFEDGADGVCLVGCLEGDCHFLVGNIRARKRVEYLKHLLDESGIGGERIALYNMSSAQGQRFAEVAREMTEKIRSLGPNPAKKMSGSSGQAVKGSSELHSTPDPSDPH
jgi:F420-non-reducing hydrogenase iron-sulfur subunit